MLFIFKKLNTKEDNLFIHKTVGVFCLCNFFYRYYLLIRYGEMFLDNRFGLFSILVHGVLSYSSLIFNIPSVRNPQKPMIYPEFRLHSIVFASRSILCCFIEYYRLHYFFKMAVIYLTMIVADKITVHFKDKEKQLKEKWPEKKEVKSNGTTMSNMPFDDGIPLSDQKNITLLNSSMQLSATIFMLSNMDMCFSPLFAIQIASFLMTLVRKSIISARMWHIIYSLSLWINVIFYLVPKTTVDFIFIQVAMFYIYKNIYFKYKVNKYTAWTSLFILYFFYNNYVSFNISCGLELFIRYYMVFNYLNGVLDITQALLK
jgi:hypothetical protein